MKTIEELKDYVDCTFASIYGQLADINVTVDGRYGDDGIRGQAEQAYQWTKDWRNANITPETIACIVTAITDLGKQMQALRKLTQDYLPYIPDDIDMREIL